MAGSFLIRLSAPLCCALLVACSGEPNGGAADAGAGSAITGAGWRSLGLLDHGNAAVGVDGKVSVGTLAMQGTADDLRVLMQHSTTTQQDPIDLYYLATVKGGAISVQEQSFGLEASTAARKEFGFFGPKPMAFFRMPKTVNDVKYLLRAADGSPEVRWEVMPSDAQYRQFHPLFAPVGTFIAHTETHGYDNAPYPLDLHEAKAGALTKVATVGTPKHGVPYPVKYWNEGSGARMAYLERAITTTGAPKAGACDLVILAESAGSWTEVSRNALTAAQAAVLSPANDFNYQAHHLEYRHVGGVDWFAAYDLSKEVILLKVEGTTLTEVKRVTVPAQDNTPIHIALGDGAAYVAFADTESTGRATVLKVDGSGATPVGARGFARANAAVFFLGGKVYATVPGAKFSLELAVAE